MRDRIHLARRAAHVGRLTDRGLSPDAAERAIAAWEAAPESRGLSRDDPTYWDTGEIWVLERRRDDVRGFRADDRFGYLDRALRLRPSQRTEFQRRALTAGRTLALATPMLRRQLRVILVATALEALLGAESPSGTDPEGKFSIARRAAYLYCGDPDDRHPGRTACFYLRARSEREMIALMKERSARGERVLCTDFWHAMDLLRDRNAALHEARDQFERSRVMWHVITAERVVLCAIGWALRHGVTSLSERDAELDAFVHVGREVTRVASPRPRR